MQPTITDWLQGIGTAAGTIFAAVAAVAAVLLLLHEIRVRRQDEADRQAAQARSVFVTFEEVNSDKRQPMLPRHGDKLVANVDIYIRNLSDAVIADASWKATRIDNETVILVVRNDFLGPGEKSGMRCALDPPQLWRLGTNALDLFRFDLEFTDARGLRWRRVNRNHPVREIST